MSAPLRTVIGLVAVLGVAASATLAGTAALADTPSRGAAATAEPTAAPSAAPEPTAEPTPGPTASAPADPSDSAAPSSDDVSAATDPSIAVQDADGNHVMGSTVAENEPAPSSGPRIQSKSLAATSISKASSSSIKGLDVSAYQPSVDWKGEYKNGARFAYIKATESTTYKSATFASQYSSSASVGMVRGAYHFAHPDVSAAAQAKYFVANGGNWSGDGKTLPPLLDIEYGTSKGECWGLSDAQMVTWIKSFSDTMKSLTGRVPAIYAGYYWWVDCTGNSKAFSANTLMVPSYGRSLSQGPVGIGASWSDWNIWQYSSTGPYAGDSDVFNGSQTQLKALAVPTAAVDVANSPKGYVDSVTTVPGGIRVRGWTVDPNATKSSIKVHIHTGAKITSLTANKSRPDVAASNPAWGAAHGFDGVVAIAKGSYSSCVYGMNVSKGANKLLEPCVSSKSLGSTPVGPLESVKTTPTSITVSGWSMDGSTAASIKVATYVDGSRVSTASASRTRADVGRAYPNYGSAHGYSVKVSAKQGTHTVCVYGLDSSSGAKSLLGSCTKVAVNMKPVGVVDKITPSKGAVTVAGWTYDPDAVTKSIGIAVYVDSKGVRLTANTSRPDVAKHHAGVGSHHGFSKKVTASKGKHTVCVYAIDSSGGSNPKLKCSVVTVS